MTPGESSSNHVVLHGTVFVDMQAKIKNELVAPIVSYSEPTRPQGLISRCHQHCAPHARIVLSYEAVTSVGMFGAHMRTTTLSGQTHGQP